MGEPPLSHRHVFGRFLQCLQIYPMDYIPPSWSTIPTLICTLAQSRAPRILLVALHFLGMYASTVSLAAFCIVYVLVRLESGVGVGKKTGMKTHKHTHIPGKRRIMSKGANNNRAVGGGALEGTGDRLHIHPFRPPPFTETNPSAQKTTRGDKWQKKETHKQHKQATR